MLLKNRESHLTIGVFRKKGGGVNSRFLSENGSEEQVLKKKSNPLKGEGGFPGNGFETSLIHGPWKHRKLRMDGPKNARIGNR